MSPKRPTSADVAALAGVSRTTVSLVLNKRDVQISPATRQRVLDAARELDYRPDPSAQQLAGGPSRTIGLVLGQPPDQVAGDQFLAETLRGLTASASAHGYRVLVEAHGPSEAPYRDLILSRRIDGLVVSGPRVGETELETLVQENFPVVFHGWLPGADAPSVDVDNREGARLAVQHLIGLGHRTIACITNAAVEFTAARERLEGYQVALRDANIEPDPAWVEEAAFDAPSGQRAMAALLARMNPQAVFAASDLVSVGAIRALRQAGHRVPEDVSVVGFDDIPLAAHLDPPLTTIRLPAFALGQAAGRALLERIADRGISARTLLPTQLIVRESTGPPRLSQLSGGAA